MTFTQIPKPNLADLPVRVDRETGARLLSRYYFAISILFKDFAADRDQAATFLYIHRSLGVTTWIVAICRLVWRLSFSFLPPFPETMSKVQQWLAKISEYGLYAILLIQPLTGLGQSLTRGRPFFVFIWEVPSIITAGMQNSNDAPVVASIRSSSRYETLQSARPVQGRLSIYLRLHQFVRKRRDQSCSTPQA